MEWLIVRKEKNRRRASLLISRDNDIIIKRALFGKKLKNELKARKILCLSILLSINVNKKIVRHLKYFNFYSHFVTQY